MIENKYSFRGPAEMRFQTLRVILKVAGLGTLTKQITFRFKV